MTKTNEGAHNTASRQQEALALARQLFAAQFPLEDFDALVWDMSSLEYRQATLTFKRLHFTRYQMPDHPLPEPFVHLIKSWIVLDGKSLADRHKRLLAARHLWEIVLQRRQGKVEAFRWELLTLEDVCQTELHLLTTRAEASSYQLASYLKLLTDFLEARQICLPFHFLPQIQRPKRAYIQVSREKERQDTKLPTPRALEGLAEIYRVHAKEPPDRLRIAAIALFVVCGLRAWELLSLPVECEVEEELSAPVKIRAGLGAF